ncbi:MAG: cytochrome c3 family protein [Thermodesulfobacteriota bacterium]|nr:cytochrome c3 family protein [Thermodesulfobacteriota bacterium]
MKQSARLTLLFLFSLTLFIATAGANEAPIEVTYAQNSSHGPVIFDHEGHSDFVANSCSNAACHADSDVQTKIVLNKKTAHGKMCRTCHSHFNKKAGEIVAPIKCYECHLEDQHRATPRLCQDGRKSDNCKKCHK